MEVSYVTYAVLVFGGFLGIGETCHPVPWSVPARDPAKERNKVIEL